MTKPRLLRATGAATFAAAFAGLLAAMPAPASALECSSDPLRTAGISVEGSQKLFRFQERPWARVPTGASLTVRAPEGVTEADLHRALRCTSDPTSPLAVPGAALKIERVGDRYEVQVTSKVRSSALEIQRRAAAL